MWYHFLHEKYQVFQYESDSTETPNWMKPRHLNQHLHDWLSWFPQRWGRLFNRYAAMAAVPLLNRLKCCIPQHIPIATKLAVTFTLLIAGGMILIGLLVGTNQSKLLEKQMAQFGVTLTHQLAESSKEPLLAVDRLGLELLLNSLSNQPNVLGTAALSDEGIPLVVTGLVPPHNVLRSNGVGISNGKGVNIEWSAFDGPRRGTRLISFIEAVKYQDLTVGYALITFDKSLMSEAHSDTITTVAMTITLMIFIAIAVSVLLAQRLTRPIDDLMHMSREIQQGNYQMRINERRNDELGVLMQSLNEMSEGLLRKEQVEQVFSRYVSPQVANRVLSDLQKMEHVSLGGRHVNASVIFADIVGFTALSEKLGPQETSNLLNIYFSHITQAVAFCHGHVDKYMGDCAMIVFGVPEERDDHSMLAISAAWMIQQLITQLNRKRTQEKKVTVDFRIGVNSGIMLAGNMGSTQRMEYTVVGDTVNLASRLSHAGDPGEVILIDDMLAIPSVDHHFIFEKHSTIRLRGKETPVATVRLVDVRHEFRLAMLDEIPRIIHAMQGVAA